MIRKTLLATILIITLNADEMPIAAKAGQCFTKAFYPPKYTTTTQIKSTKKVLLNDASVKYEVIPAKYTWDEKQVKISDGTEKIVTTAATYKTLHTKVLIEPASTSWRKSLNQHAEKAFSSCVESASSSGMDIQNAKVGTCFYEHYEPEEYVTTTSKILSSEASERIVVTPAKYRTISKKIMTDSTSAKLLPSKAVYKKVKDKVVIAPARTEWKKTICGNMGCNQSEVVCLTEVPTTYKKITKRIVLQAAVKKQVSVSPIYKSIQIQEMVEPANSVTIAIPPTYQTLAKKEKIKEERYYWADSLSQNSTTRLRSQCDKICLIETPAKYQDVAKKVVVIPASSKKVSTPEKYKMVRVKKILEEASFRKVVIPEEYITVVTQKERTRGHAKWMPMVCEANITPNTIRKIQQALKFQGFYQGEVDGIWSIESKSAARAYQKEKGLTVTHKLSIETMISLNIY